MAQRDQRGMTTVRAPPYSDQNAQLDSALQRHGELDTAVRHKLPLLSVISLNGGWTADPEHNKPGRRSHGIAAHDIETVWTAIALHTTPGIPQFMHPVIALVTAGVEMDVLGIAFFEFTEAERDAVVHAHPRSGRFKEEIIQAFYDASHLVAI
jgi:hypothetical protein